MAEAAMAFPHWYYSAKEPAGRVFASKEALDAANGEGPWYPTPTEAADAAAHAAPPEPSTEEGSTPPRSRR